MLKVFSLPMTPMNRKDLNRTQKPEYNVCDELRDLAPMYILGTATSDEIARVKVLLEKCPEVRADMAAYATAAATFYAQAAPAVPPADLHDRLMARLHTTSAEEQSAPLRLLPLPTMRKPVRRTGWIMAVAAVLILALINIYWLNQWNAASVENLALRRQQQDLLAFTTAPDVNRVALVNDSVAVATLFWRHDTSDALLTSVTLPSTEADQVYQLWLIDGEQPESAGTFRADESGVTTISISPPQPIGQYQAIAISIEPFGGSTAPTTTPIAQGEI